MIPREKPIPALLNFITSWVTALSASHRIAQSAIPKFVPPPLRAIYEIAGNWPVPNNEQWRPPDWTLGLFGPQDHLLPIDKLQIEDGRLLFLVENQGVWSCETLIDADDPPIYSDCLSQQAGDKRMHEVCGSLSHFLTTYCLQELVFGSLHLFSVDSEVTTPNDLVKGKLHALWENGTYVFKEPSHSFYVCNDQVMVMSTFGSYWIACKEDGALDLIANSPHEIRRIN